MATTASSLPHPPPPKRHEGKRIFRSISRFLSGGSKSRPKLASNPTGAHTPPPQEEDVQLREVRRAESRASTSASVLTGDDSLTGADTDASLRPISPSSAAPSSFVSRTSTASLAPTHRTFLSSASTKPTTLLSIDSTAGGANRIAVVPGTGLSSASGQSLSPTSSSPIPGSGITFSSLPPHLDSQVPRHTLAHPRNNPHPASPPPDNASMLTLASSSSAPSFSPSRLTNGAGSLLGNRRIEADEDASVRALAPSRRASDESLGSRSTWSAAVRRDKTASLRTVGTSGTGYWGGEGEETEAQRVVSEAREEEEEESHLRTPKRENEAILPIVPPPLPAFSTPTTSTVANSLGLAEPTPKAVAGTATIEEGITTPTKINGMGTGIGTGLDTRSVASGAETEGSFKDAESRLGSD